MKLIPLIAALVFAQPTKTFNQEPEARTANLQFTVDDISGKRVALNS